MAKMEDWVLGNNTNPIVKKPLLPPTQEQLDAWRIAQEASKNASQGSPNIISGALATAFPKTYMLVGGADEINRRANIYDSGTPMAPPKMPVQPNNSSQSPVAQPPIAPLATQESLDRRTYTVPEGTASGIAPQGQQRGGFVGAPTDAIAARSSDLSHPPSCSPLRWV